MAGGQGGECLPLFMGLSEVFPHLGVPAGFFTGIAADFPMVPPSLLLSHFQGAIDGLAGSSDEEVSPAWPIPFAEPDIALKEPATARW
jgi:hypothetical protein